MKNRWQRLRGKLFRFALSISLLILIVAAVFVLWPDDRNQPLTYLDLLDLRDNSTALTLPLTLHNSGRLPLAIDQVRLDGEGRWRIVDDPGWLREERETLPPGADIAADGVTDVAANLPGRATRQLIIELVPAQGRSDQSLQIRYHILWCIPYTLTIPLQTEGVFLP